MSSAPVPTPMSGSRPSPAGGLVAGEILLVALPAAAFLVARGGRDPHGAFAGWLAACAVLATIAAFAAPRPTLLLRRALPGLLLVVVAAGILAGADPWVGTLMLLALAAAPYGLATAGRATGAPAVPSAFVAVGVLLVAMTGFFWADRVASALPPARRYVVRQAVVDADPALASAYGVLGYDRMRDPDVYFRVQLASGLIRTPSASRCAVCWLTLGVLAGGLGGMVLLGRRERGAPALDGEVAGREGGREPPERSAAPRPGL